MGSSAGFEKRIGRKKIMRHSRPLQTVVTLFFCIHEPTYVCCTEQSTDANPRTLSLESVKFQLRPPRSKAGCNLWMPAVGLSRSLKSNRQLSGPNELGFWEKRCVLNFNRSRNRLGRCRVSGSKELDMNVAHPPLGRASNVLSMNELK